MSDTTYLKMWGIFVMLSLMLTAMLVVPAGVTGEGMATLKVSIRDDVYLDSISGATVTCVNVHSGVSYTLYEDNFKYKADVMPGTYRITAMADGYNDGFVVEKRIEGGEVRISQIYLERIGHGADIEVRIYADDQDDGNEIEGAQVHIYSGTSHMMVETTEKGYGNMSVPFGESLHLLVFEEGYLTHSVNIELNESVDMY